MATSDTGSGDDKAKPKPESKPPSQTPVARTVSRRVFNDFAAI